MLVICYGQPKSASSYVHKVTADLVEAAGFDQAAARERYLGSVSVPYEPHPYFVELCEGDARKLSESIAPDDILVVKCHGALHDDIRELVEEGRIRVITSFREPRDCVVSHWDAHLNELHRPEALRRPFFADIADVDECIGIVAVQIKLLDPWLELNQALGFGYDYSTAECLGMAAEIAEYLGLDGALAASVCATLKQRREAIPEFNVGRPGRHATALTPAQQADCERIFQPLEKTLQQALKRSSQHAATPLPRRIAAIRNSFGEAAFRRGDLAEAQRRFESAVAADGDFAVPYNNLAVLFWEAGDTGSCIVNLARALECDLWDRDVICNAGQILAALDKRDEAAALCRRFLDRYPADAGVAELLRSLDAGLGDDEAAQTPEGVAATVAGDESAAEVLALIDYSLPANAAAAPLISVIVPSFNQARYLETTLSSILDQNYPNLELIVMDGGSTDGSVEIIGKYSDRIAYWQSQPDEGQYWAIDRGIRHCHGEIITWLNSDDLMLPNAFNRVASIFSQCPGIEWVTGVPNTVDQAGAPKWAFPGTPVYCQQNYLRKRYDFPHYIQQEGTFWRRSLWERAGAKLDVGLKMAGDLELWARFFRYTALYTLGEKTASFRQHVDQKTAEAMALYHEEADAVLEREIELFRQNGGSLIAPVAPLRFGMAVPGHDEDVLPPGPREAGTGSGRAVLPATAPSSGPGGQAIAVATSIAPKELDKQKYAIASWLELGIEVVSINSRKEIDLLEKHFPGVRFVAAGRTGEKLAGKPYVFLTDVFRALRATERPVVGVVNSDIILRGDPAMLNNLVLQACDSLLYGSRLDIADREDRDGKLYHHGYDYFFMDRRLLQLVTRGSRFMMGIPWWDLWLPTLMLKAGVTLKRIRSPFAWHVWHTTNYSQQRLKEFGNIFASTVVGAPFLQVWEQCVRGNYGDVRFDVLAESARAYITRCSEDVLLSDTAGDSAFHSVAHLGIPKVSAIVSTYCSEAFIEQCLNDLVGQTLAAELEIIVIDAASPQGEGEIVRRFQSRFPNIRYHRTPERIGVYAAWNMAVKMARGEYLITCSTNDRLRFDACEILARTLDENPDIVLTYGNSYLSKLPHDDFFSPTLCGLYVWPLYSYELLTERCMVGPHPMWRRTVHDTLGYFNEELVALGDQDFWLRLGETYDMRAIPDFTGLYFVSESSITGNTDLTQIEADRIHAQYQWRYRYGEWFTRRYRRARAVAGGADKAAFDIVVINDDSEPALLADTLDSIAAQTCERWRLTVISTEPCPDPLFEQEERLSWLHAAGTAARGPVLERISAASAADWIIAMQAGDRLEATCCADLLAYIGRYPEWKLIYTDDDRVDSNGDLSEPRFKPDFNLELVRATPYIGRSMAIRRIALREAGGFGETDAAVFQDVVLRIHDRYSRGGIGHVADVAFHTFRPDASEWSAGERAEFEAVLRRHLQRCGEEAKIEAGPVPDSFALEYPAGSAPVSILIATRGDNPNLPVCVEAVLSKTAYPAFEVRVLNMAGKSHTVHQQLASLAADARLTITDCPANESETQLLNRTAAAAGGALLLWLNESVVVLQENWLTHLAAQLGRPGVGVAGARIINRRKHVVHGGVVLGTGSRGVGGRTFEGLHMTSPGYLGLAQLARESSAVSGLCMLTDRELFLRTGGFSEKLRVSLFRDIDYCLRLSEQGLASLWTPRATLIYLGERAQVDGSPDSEEHVEREAAFMHEHWLDRLAGDPQRNRNFRSFDCEHALEIKTMPGWNAEIDSLPRVLSFAVGGFSSWQYRVKQPLAALTDEDLIQCTHTPLITRSRMHLPSPVEIARLQPDTLLMHNTLHDDYLDAMAKYKKVNKAFLVFGQDDLMNALPAKNPFAKSMYRDIKQRIRKSLALADRLVVTTEPLAEALRGMADEIQVLPNYLDGTVWRGLESQRGVSDRARVGWAGAQQHQGDLELLGEVVRATADEVDWVFFGMCPDFLRPYVAEYHPAVTFDQYPGRLAALNLDIAVAPLEHHAFNEAKSNLRVLEYGILGWSVIASDIAPYQDAPVCRVPNQPRAWINAIRERAHDPASTWLEGDRLRHWVEDGWLLQAHLERWLTVLNIQAADAGRYPGESRAAGL